MTGGAVVVLGPDDHHRAGDVPAGTTVLLASRRQFGDGEQLVGLPPSDVARVSGQAVLVVHTTAPPQDQRLYSLLQLVEAVAGAGAKSVTCFVPYLCYQRQDRRTAAGEPLSAGIVLRALAAVGVRTVLTVDRHSDLVDDPDVTVVNLDCVELVAEFVRAAGVAPEVVVSTDAGGALRARHVADRLGLPTVVLDKSKSTARGTYYEHISADLTARRCLVVEDLCSTGTTLRPLFAALRPVVADAALFVTHVLHGYQALRTALPDVKVIGYSDSCGDPAAPVRVLPLALAAHN